MKIKRITRIFLLLLVAVMLFGFSGCGEKLFAAETTEPTTEAPAAGTAPLASSELKVGVLFGYAEGDTSYYFRAHSDGIAHMKSELGLSDEQVIIKYGVTEATAAAALKELVDGGCRLIFGAQKQFAAPMLASAAQNASVVFCCNTDEPSAKSPNFEAWNVRVWEPYYLAGIAAGLKAAQLGDSKLGFVSAMDTSQSSVTACVNAFALGALSVNPLAEVKVVVTGEWLNEGKEAAAARKLIDAGCKVIAKYTDTSAAIKEAEKAGVFACGNSIDCTAEAPQNCLCSTVSRFGVYYLETAQRVIGGKWKAGAGESASAATSTDSGKTPVFLEGSDVGAVSLVLNEEIAADGTAQAINSAQAKLISGSSPIFAGALTKADGTPVSGKITDSVLLGAMNYYIKGIELLH